MDRVYEVGRIFRNEGMDPKHNPEFTTIELYQAYTDFHGMMDLVEDMMKQVAQNVCGSLVVPYQGHEIDLGHWERLTMIDAVKKYSGVDFRDWKTDEDAIASAKAHNVALHEAEHEQPAEEDEQHGVGVDGGNARLREVLAVQREHQRGGECKAGFFRQLLAQQVHRRQHQDARQCAHHAPAERNHAENRNAKAHDDLAKRRMARFIRRSAVQVLIRRAGVVNLVEIGAVPPARQTFQRILLVENIVCVAVKGGFLHHVQLRNDRRRNAVAVCVLEDDFIHLQPDLLRRDADIPRREFDGLRVEEALVVAVFIFAHIAGGEVLPLEALAFRHIRNVIVRPAFAVLGYGDGEIGVAHLTEVEHRHIVVMFAEVDDDLLIPRRGDPRVLRRFHGAEVRQRHDGVHQRYAQHQQPVTLAPVQGNVLLKGARVARLLLQLLHGQIRRVLQRFVRCGYRQAHVAARPHAEECQRHVRRGQQHRQHDRIIVQVPQRRTEAQAVIQHNAFVDECRRAEAQQEHQRPAVALARVRHPQQEQRREQIPLVHLDAEHIQQHKQHAAAQGEVLQFAAADEHGQHHHKRQRHGDKPHHCEAGIEGRQAEENQREGQPSGDFRRIPVRLLAPEEHHAKRNCARQPQQTHDQQRCAGKHHAAAQMENHRARPAALRREEAAQPETADNQQNRHQPRQHVGLPAAFLRAVNQPARPDE